jgi:4-diphosphocytidyl-2-C-methyl-D-erythritol kinase
MKKSWHLRPYRCFFTPVKVEFGREGELVRVKAPAKINLTLAVHGKRPDGFHALTSLIAPVDFGDDLEVRRIDADADRLICDDGELPVDDSNLVLKAARFFREKLGVDLFFEFRLTKRIPVGAGLGGGSSDGVASLKALNALCGNPLARDDLLEQAARLGSDCPFFVDARPALMRGRGEVLDALDEEAVSRLRGRRIVLFRPPFAVNTGWAFCQLVQAPGSYMSETDAVKIVADFRDRAPIDQLLQNAFESVVGRKYLALPLLLERLRAEGYICLLSGSGSCCFALTQNSADVAEIVAISRDCWGERIFWVETSIC